MSCPAGVKLEEKPGKSIADLSNPFSISCTLLIKNGFAVISRSFIDHFTGGKTSFRSLVFIATCTKYQFNEITSVNCKCPVLLKHPG